MGAVIVQVTRVTVVVVGVEKQVEVQAAVVRVAGARVAVVGIDIELVIVVEWE